MADTDIIHLELLKMMDAGKVWASCPKCKMPLDRIDDEGLCCNGWNGGPGCGNVSKHDALWHRVNVESLN